MVPLNFIALYRNLILNQASGTPGFLKLLLSRKSICVCVGMFASGNEKLFT